MPSPVATVVIVNYNGESLLRPCLDAVHRQDFAQPFETVVVDNASADSSLAVLKEYPWVRVLASPTNTGFAGGNNLALHESRTPYTVLLNNDAVPEPSWLRSLLAPFDAPGADDLAVVTGKVVFLPRFLRLSLQTEGFSPGPHDARELGVRVYELAVDGRDVTDKVLWEQVAYGPEGVGAERFRWTRPTGELLVPVSDELAPARPITITFRVAAERDGKEVSLGAGEVVATGTAGTTPTELVLVVPIDAELHDVINNVGGIVLTEGYGADRGFQEVDGGQYDEPAEVFTACGNGMAMRTDAARDVGFFDDDFFMYYEDTDLSWRLRARGWRIRYEPTAVLRHIHAASSKEWSPFWVFHVDRNRLLMLVKNASLGLALRTIPRYAVTSASMGLRTVRSALRSRARPALRPHLVRAKVLLSFLRLLGPMVARRRRLGREATVSRAELERWLVAHR